MNLFKPKAKDSEPVVDPVAVSVKQTERTLRNDRQFWDDVVRFSLNSDNPPAEAIRHVIQIADSLLEERRKRFPIQERADDRY